MRPEPKLVSYASQHDWQLSQNYIEPWTRVMLVPVPLQTNDAFEL